MDADESLSSILSSSEAPVAESVAVPAEVQTEAQATEKTASRDASGKFAKAGEEPAAKVAEAKPAEPPKAAEPEAAKRPDVAAIIDERRKRQAAEQERDQLRQQLQQPTAKPSVFEDEDAAIASRVQEQLAPIRAGLFHQSIEIARSKHGEAFEEARVAFEDAAEADPNLVAALRASSNPGAFVFAEGLRIKELAEVGGDFLKYREKVTAGHTAALAERDTRIGALQAELDALKKTNKDLESLPRSLNKSPSGSLKSGEEDEDDIQSIVRFNPRKSG